ncbi:hypothetical protein [Paenibacillus sp. Soil522]|uniref:hypothetical protein n=1 Tax=Paenibacillus sp. Soil522 TaxID=1736388 RepID=UPI0007000A20|nr:hypothetical protein [Paenibacillus sp. Soil522]KRE47034.1 hypothetical protein ASG81_09145 [Paenibacillus sp. Soil522]
MKKLKVLTVLALAGVIALSGCSSGSKVENSNSATPKESATATNSEEPVTPEKLTWFADGSYWNPPSPWSTDPNTVEGAITQKTGLTFDFNVPAQDGVMKLSLMLTTLEDLPDIITLTDGKMQKKLVDSGKVWNLEEFMQKYNPESTLIKTFPEDVRKAMIRKDGAWYAIPSHINSEDLKKMYPPASELVADAGNYAHNHNAMFNEKIMKEAGISVDDLKTEDGVLAAFEKVKSLKVDGAPVIPLHIGGKFYQGDTFYTLQEQFGAMNVDKDGNYRDVIFSSEMKHVMEFLNKTYRNGYLDPGQMILDHAGIAAAIATGRVFCFIGNVAITNYTNKDLNMSWVSPGPIQSNQNTKPVFGRNLQTGTGWMQTYVAKTAKHPERIAKWLDFMTSDDGKALLFYGFEGTHYTVKDGLFIRTEQGIKGRTDQTKTGIDMFWQFDNRAWWDHVTPAPSDPIDIMGIQVMTAAAKASIMYDGSALAMPEGLFPAGSKEANAEAEIKLYREAQISKIVLSKDEAEFNKNYDELISKLKNLGQSEIDAKKNEKFHEQQQEYGTTLKGINS